MKFPRTVLVLASSRTYLVTAAILWPRYRHIESCVAVGVSPVNARLLITCDTAFYAIISNATAQSAAQDTVHNNPVERITRETPRIQDVEPYTLHTLQKIEILVEDFYVSLNR